MDNDSMPTNTLIDRALQKTGAKNIAELKIIFSTGLGTSWQGRKILNSNDFTLKDIAQIRALIKNF